MFMWAKNFLWANNYLDAHIGAPTSGANGGAPLRNLWHHNVGADPRVCPENPKTLQ